MSHKKKRVGISLRVENIKKYNEKRDALSQDWTSFLGKLNSIPIMIPNALPDVKSFLTEMELDGIILSGGDNIGDNPERDRTEKEIIDFAINSGTPILGVCRGMQVINHHFGGSILSTDDLDHVGKPHPVKLTNMFSKFFQTNTIEVNSYHNNIIKKEKLGKNLEPFAISKTDETVEGFFHKSLPIIGVMWHPERDSNLNSESILMKIFQNRLIWAR